MISVKLLMIGLGSGRRLGGGHIVAESCRSLDVNQLHRAGLLSTSASRVVSWDRHGEDFGSVTLRMREGLLKLSYRCLPAVTGRISSKMS